jgi:hypothetical protein
MPLYFHDLFGTNRKEAGQLNPATFSSIWQAPVYLPHILWLAVGCFEKRLKNRVP